MTWFKTKNRFKTKTILQMETTECGAAALGIILSYFGKDIPLEELRESCGISRDGSKATNLLAAGRHYGLESYGANVEMAELSELDSPVILFWGFTHFVVFEGRRGDKYYINDPATGPRTLDKTEFSKQYTGVALVFELTDDFKQAKKPERTLWQLIQKTKHHKSTMMFIVFAALALIIPGIALPGFSKIFIDNILVQNMSGWLLPLIVGLFITAVIRGILSWLQLIHLLKFHISMLLSSSADTLWHILRLPLSFFTQRYSGDILDRLQANDRVAMLLASDISATIVNAFSAILFFFVMCLLSVKLALIALVIVLLNAMLLKALSRGLADSSRKLLQDDGHLLGIEMNGIRSIETLKAMGADDDFFRLWAGNHAKVMNGHYKLSMYGQAMTIIPKFINQIGVVFLLSIGAHLIMRGDITVGTLVAIQTLMSSFTSPFISLIQFGSQLQQIKGDLARLKDVSNQKLDLRFSTEKTEETGQSTSKRLLSIKDLSFGYSKLEAPLLENINFDVAMNQKVTIIGKSGSGKSTIARLICGLHTPWAGSIHLGDRNIDQINPKDLAQYISYVDQDIFLFEDTLRHNLSMWDNSISDEQIYQALADTCMDDVVLARGGLDCRLSEMGMNFSGGQRQKLEIARALVNQPTLLVLDEATSAIDTIVEKTIYHNINKRNIGMLVISHRLSAVQESDEILVMSKGQLIDRGTHEQLLNRSEYYTTLVRQE